MDDIWYVLRTRSRFEKKTYEALSNMGISAYLPIKKTQKQWSDRLKVVEEPLFSGYVFVQFQEKDRYSILNLPGVVKFVSFAGNYATIRPAQIQVIKTMLLNENTVEVVNPDLYPGQKIRITSGAFKGIEAVLVYHNGKGKLMLEVAEIGQGVLLEIGRTKIEQIVELSQVS